ncbi:MAG TPA: SDR family oxidoreductase [Roseiflexaceae bacterium]|nr:SDR family oxidoreductase [Roseiflexaceae bacterium]
MADLFRGKVAIVTGAASGIGRAAALAFAREGAQVVVSDVDAEGGAATAQAIVGAGGMALFVRADVASALDVAALVDRTMTSYGRLDCAFNNAGINQENAPAAELAEELWDRTIAVNLKGVWLCMKYEIPAMLASGGGAIVNTASVVGLSGRRDTPAYVASKHGIVGLTKATALDYGKRGIRVNAVCPGTIRTAMYVQRLGDDPAVDARLAASTPIGRIGMSEDVAEAVIWLCSDAAAFVTGHSMVIDGGDTA